MILERLFDRLLKHGLGKEASLDIHRVKMDTFDRLAEKYGVKSKYAQEVVRVYGEPYERMMWKSADLNYKGIRITIYSEHADNPNYSDEAAKARCREERERRIAHAKRELEYLPKVNCETEGRMM